MPTLPSDIHRTYCFHYHRVSGVSAATRQSIAQWMEREIPRQELAVLHWYGGEGLW